MTIWICVEIFLFLLGLALLFFSPTSKVGIIIIVILLPLGIFQIIYTNVESSSMHKEIKDMKERISKMEKSREKEFNAQFTGGYQLFGTIGNQIIPSQKPPSNEIKIDWSTAKILDITPSFIKIMLPDAILPGGTILESNSIGIENREGAVATGGIVIGDWSTYVRILKSDGSKIIAVVGYVKIR